jgi:hypothetical protein
MAICDWFNIEQMYLIEHWKILFIWTLNNLIWLNFEHMDLTELWTNEFDWTLNNLIWLSIEQFNLNEHWTIQFDWTLSNPISLNIEQSKLIEHLNKWNWLNFVIELCRNTYSDMMFYVNCVVCSISKYSINHDQHKMMM